MAISTTILGIDLPMLRPEHCADAASSGAARA
jgi:hypothetical protein